MKSAMMLVIGVGTLLLSSCSTAPVVARRSGCAELVITRVGEIHGTVHLRINGRLVDSARGVDEIVVAEDGTTINLTLLTRLNGQPPDFQKDIEVPFYVNRVTFGQEKSLLWTR